MVKFVNLVKNELLKQYKKVSIFVLVIVFAVFTFVTPFLMWAGEVFFSSVFNISYTEQPKKETETPEEKLRKSIQEEYEKSKHKGNKIYEELYKLTLDEYDLVVKHIFSKKKDEKQEKQEKGNTTNFYDLNYYDLGIDTSRYIGEYINIKKIIVFLKERVKDPKFDIEKYWEKTFEDEEDWDDEFEDWGEDGVWDNWDNWDEDDDDFDFDFGFGGDRYYGVDDEYYTNILEVDFYGYGYAYNNANDEYMGLTTRGKYLHIDYLKSKNIYELQNFIDILEKDAKTLMKIIEKDDEMLYLNHEVDLLNRDLEYLKSPDNTIKNPENLKNNILLLEYHKKCMDLRVAQSMSYGDKRINTLNSATDNYSTYLNINILSEEKFQNEMKRHGGHYDEYSSYYFDRNTSYYEYTRIMSHMKEQYLAFAEENFHSAKYDIPLIEDNFQSLRYTIIELSKSSLPILILIIIIASTIVSSEFSRGTIRLMLIHPVSRTSFILSKYAAVILTALLSTVGYILLSLIPYVIRYGISDLWNPVLVYNNGVVNEVNFFIYILPNVLWLLIGLLFISTFTFAMSALTRNSVVSCILGVLANSIYLILPFEDFDMMPYMSALPKGTWLAYTPLPYLNIYIYGIEKSIYSTYYNINKLTGFHLNLYWGSLMVIGLTGLLLAWTIYSFNRKDVK